MCFPSALEVTGVRSAREVRVTSDAPAADGCTREKRVKHISLEPPFTTHQSRSSGPVNASRVAVVMARLHEVMAMEVRHSGTP